jgi:hypothetical protein
VDFFFYHLPWSRFTLPIFALPFFFFFFLTFNKPQKFRAAYRDCDSHREEAVAWEGCRSPQNKAPILGLEGLGSLCSAATSQWPAKHFL